MTAINVLRQRKSVHLLTDMAAYDKAGVLHSVDHRKCVSMPSLQAAVACTGPAMLGFFFASRLPEMFESFDHLISEADRCLPELFRQYARSERAGDAFSTLYLIGWHKAKPRPAAYAVDMWTESSSRLRQVLANSSNADTIEPFKLKEQLLAGTPAPDPSLLAEAGFDIPDDENEMVPAVDLLHLLEIQRHERIEDAHWVGGGAWLTSIDHKGITQRVIHRWDEDCVGGPIKPAPLDWSAWRLCHGAGSGRRRPTWRTRLLSLFLRQ